MKQEIIDIIHKNEDNIDANEFLQPLETALKEGVASELLDVFGSDVPVPTEQLFDVLKEHYIDNNSKLTTEEKATKEKFIQYLINKYQISIFESIAKNK